MGFCGITIGLTGFQWGLLNFNGVLRDYNRAYWILTGFTGYPVLRLERLLVPTIFESADLFCCGHF